MWQRFDLVEQTVVPHDEYEADYNIAYDLKPAIDNLLEANGHRRHYLQAEPDVLTAVDSDPYLDNVLTKRDLQAGFDSRKWWHAIFKRSQTVELSNAAIALALNRHVKQMILELNSNCFVAEVRLDSEIDSFQAGMLIQTAAWSVSDIETYTSLQGDWRDDWRDWPDEAKKNAICEKKGDLERQTEARLYAPLIDKNAFMAS